jgi:hypothetical protein
MTDKEFGQICDEAFSQIYAKAKATNKVQFLTSCFAFYKQQHLNIMSYVTDYELQEVLELISRFKQLQEVDEVEAKTKTRIQLFLYCHIIEVDIVYMILFNMLKTIKGERYSPTISYRGKKGDIVEAKYPSQKIELIAKESQQVGVTLGPIYSEFYFNHLRNAFSHSQYFLDEDGGIILTVNLSPATLAVYKQAVVKSSFKTEEVHSLFNKSLLYVESFERHHMHSLESFMDGCRYQTDFGQIYYSRHDGRWLFVQNP